MEEYKQNDINNSTYYISENGHWFKIHGDNSIYSFKKRGGDEWLQAEIPDTTIESDYRAYCFSLPDFRDIRIQVSDNYLIENKKKRSFLTVQTGDFKVSMRLFHIDYLFESYVKACQNQKKFLPMIANIEELEKATVVSHDTHLMIEAASEEQAEKYADLLREKFNVSQGVQVQKPIVQYGGGFSSCVQLDFAALPEFENDGAEENIDLNDPSNEKTAPMVRKRLLDALFQERNKEFVRTVEDQYEDPVIRLTGIVRKHVESIRKWYYWNGVLKSIFLLSCVSKILEIQLKKGLTVDEALDMEIKTENNVGETFGWKSGGQALTLRNAINWHRHPSVFHKNKAHTTTWDKADDVCLFSMLNAAG